MSVKKPSPWDASPEPSLSGLTLADQEPTTTTRHKIIVGIDYGTTFSGVSYVTSDKAGIEDVNVIHSWPGSGRDVSVRHKTPSRIAYASENLNFPTNKWGFEVTAGHLSYTWTKLLLDQSALPTEHDDPSLDGVAGKGYLTLPPGKTAVKVVEDYLKELYAYTLSALEREITKDTLAVTPMEFWFTIPAIWSDQAKSATLTAAKNAGFGARHGDKICMIAEPEAAALTTLCYSTRPGPNQVHQGDNILVCDCGGGTVDITSYNITSTHPRLQFDEICVGMGGKCGATYIDRNLHRLLSERFGDAFDSLPAKRKGPGSRLMNSFELVKHDFGWTTEMKTHEIGPLNMDVEDTFFYDSDEGSIKLSHDDMCSIFDPVVGQVADLLSKQVQAANSKGFPIDRIVLVGGFSDSPYLYSKIREWGRDHNRIRVMCPQHPQAAIVKGAALRGLEGLAPRKTQCRRHYGFVLSKDFRPGIDLEEDSYYSKWDGAKRARDYMRWVIRKGDPVFEDTYRTKDFREVFYAEDKFKAYLSIYSCGDDDAPEKYNRRVQKMGEIAFDFTGVDRTKIENKTRNGRDMFKFDCRAEVVFRPIDGVLRFRVTRGGEEFGVATINYLDAN
ncbi:MAG: hypothetical protein M1814_004279 [Vezdaea aestivalis]|nr:MAG: hypothetical protein M1814_004279 [Vezdaea aestivalis]